MAGARLLKCITLQLCAMTATGMLVQPSCDEDAEICEFQLTLAYNYTMMRWRSTAEGLTVQRLDPVIMSSQSQVNVNENCGPVPPLSQHGNFLTHSFCWKILNLLPLGKRQKVVVKVMYSYLFLVFLWLSVLFLESSVSNTSYICNGSV